MIIRSGLRGLLLTLAILSVASNFGCATAKQRRYEERYRVFFAKDLTVENIKGLKPEEVIEKFRPEASIRGSIEDFAKQGYKITEVQPIPWGEGATLIVFRRERIQDGRPEDPAPIHFVGTYKLDDGKEPGTYYTFVQRVKGYTVHVVSPEGPKTYDAKWDMRELVWQTEAGYHHARLTPDGRCLVHLTESAQGFDVPRTITLVRSERQRVHQKADADDVREARKFTARLKPATPDWYDPYPW